MGKPEVRYDDQSVRMGSVDFFADFGDGYINLGALNDAKLVVTRKIKKLKWSNREQAPRTRITEAKFSAKLFQIKFDVLSQIDGLGEVSKVAGTKQTDTFVLNAGEAAAGQVVTLPHKNANDTNVTIKTVTYDKDGANTAWSTNTHYSLVNINGDTGIVFKNAVDKKVEIVYEYTPNAVKKIVYKNIMKSQKLSRFKFVNTNEYGKNLTIEFPKGYQSGEALELNFLNDDDNEEGIGVNVEVTAFPLVDGTVLNIIDEQDPE